MTDQALASRWQRLGGALLDAVIFLAIELPVMFVFGAFDGIAEGRGVTLGQTVGFFVFHLAVFAAINGWLLAKRGQTIGKKVAGTGIVDLDGNLRPFAVVFFVRYALIGAIANIPVVGPLFPLVDTLFIFRKNRRCLHDLMAGTRVVRAQ
ncbi:RDD family protein [Verrucomicrobiota bacterium]